MIGESEERPWGAWHIIDEADGYKVKRIEVRPRHRLSYQTHQYRSEHWTVIEGTATCVIDDETVVLRPGESCDIAVGQRHRVQNLGDTPLTIIEVQRGSYTGEDDIVRIEDDYSRC